MELSLRARLALVLLILPVASLVVISFYVARTFRRDKIAYVYESANAQAYSLNLQLDKTLAQASERLRALSYRYFNPSVEGNKPWDLGVLQAFLVVPLNQKPSPINLKFFVEAERGVVARALKSFELITQEDWKKIKSDFENLCKCWILRHSDRDYDFVGLFSQSRVWPEFNRAHSSIIALVKDDKLLDLSEKDEKIQQAVGSWIANQVKDRKSKVGSFRTQISALGAYLVSRVRLTKAPYELWLITPESAVLGVISQIFKGVLVVALALIVINTVFAFRIADGITFGIDHLMDATVRVGHGEFNFRLPNLGNNEIGQLAKAFNAMTLEIRYLLRETIQKTRMEQELKTAQLVQSTFFQSRQAQYLGGEVIGFYQSATECGGDWFYHFDDSSGRVYVVIADVTGHGVASAMATSALAIIFAELKDRSLEPHQMIEHCNRLISYVFRGALMLTMAVIC